MLTNESHARPGSDRTVESVDKHPEHRAVLRPPSARPGSGRTVESQPASGNGGLEPNDLEFVLLPEAGLASAQEFTGTVRGAKQEAALIASKTTAPVDVFQKIGTMTYRVDPDANWRACEYNGNGHKPAATLTRFPCPKCDGRGAVMKATGGPVGDQAHPSHAQTCPHCHGSGHVDVPVLADPHGAPDTTRHHSESAEETGS